jgi:transposase-like protein
LTATPNSDPPRDGRSNRRSFSADEKLAIVLETERADETVSAVARRHGIVTSILFRWRADLGFGKNKRAKLAAVKLTDGQTGASAVPLILQDLLQPPDGMAAVELNDGRRVFAPIGGDPEVVRQQVLKQEAAR